MTSTTHESLPARDTSLSGRIIISALLLILALYSLKINHESDFMQDYAAAWGWQRGYDPNAHTADLLAACCPGVKAHPSILQTAHPPLATLLTLPFALLPWNVAQHVWLLIGWSAVAWIWHTCHLHWFVCFATAGIWLVALSLGTLEPLLFALLGTALLIQERSPRLAGVLIGLASAIKIYPVVLLAGGFIGGKYKLVFVSIVSIVLATLTAELILGYGITQAWLAYTPQNTLTNSVGIENDSLVRVVRALIPSVSPLLITAFLGPLLVLPLIPALRHKDAFRPILPVMLLISPISWIHYIGLLSLGPIQRLEQIVLTISSLLIAAVWLHIVPGANLAPIAYGPLLLVMLLMWYRQVRPYIHQIPHSNSATATSIHQDEA